jgi:hypothetical protein
MTYIPEWVRHPDNVDADRVLLAGWFLRQGEADIAYGIARSITPVFLGFVEQHVQRIAELLGDWDSCLNDPRTFAYVSEGLHHPAAGVTWDEWGVGQREQILADAIMLAEQVADLADHQAVA